MITIPRGFKIAQRLFSVKTNKPSDVLTDFLDRKFQPWLRQNLCEVITVGGEQKAEAIRDIAKKRQASDCQKSCMLATA